MFLYLNLYLLLESTAFFWLRRRARPHLLRTSRGKVRYTQLPSSGETADGPKRLPMILFISNSNEKQCFQKSMSSSTSGYANSSQNQGIHPLLVTTNTNAVGIKFFPLLILSSSIALIGSCFLLSLVQYWLMIISSNAFKTHMSSRLLTPTIVNNFFFH